MGNLEKEILKEHAEILKEFGDSVKEFVIEDSLQKALLRSGAIRMDGYKTAIKIVGDKYSVFYWK